MALGITKSCLHLHISTLATVMVFFVLADFQANGEVNVEPGRALLKEGDSTNLLCRHGKPIDYCRFEIPGENVLVLSTKYNKPGFRYYGQGLAAGHCGVTIERVSAKNNGQVKCSLAVEGNEEVGKIDLLVALTPEPPIIELVSKPERDGSFVDGTRFQARCIIRNGRPAASISWLMNGEAADPRLSESEVHDLPVEGSNNTLSTTIGNIQWHLSPDDDEKKLTCRSQHQTRDQDAHYQLFVKYPPLRQPEVVVYGFYLEQTAMVNITIQANPEPVFEWHIDGLAIVPGEQKERYSAYEPRLIGKNLYNVSLAIAGLTLEDTTKTYLLKASNAIGLQEYTVRISSSSTPPSAGLDVGSIVGIVVALAILIVIVLLVIFARATGRWCFGGKSIKSPTSETSDTESAELKTKASDSKHQKFLTPERLSKLTTLFSRKNEKNSNKNETENQSGDILETEVQDKTSADDSDKPKQEDKQLVYAELVLKPSQNNQPPQPKNSTEYAEIAYVQKQTPSADENCTQNGTKKTNP